MENTGIQIKAKNRLKKNADIDRNSEGSEYDENKADIKKEIELKQAQNVQIDTTKKQRRNQQQYKAELRREYSDEFSERVQYDGNAEKLRQA